MIYDLHTIIRQQIAQSGGKISFADYMQQALYHPQAGYYTSSHLQFGKLGDFTTAPEASSLFAACIARVAEEVFAATGTVNILELGAGTGKLARDLLDVLKDNVNYTICEISPALRERQAALLQNKKVTWTSELPQHFNGLIIANEVLDALPVSLIEIHQQQVKERCVTWKDNAFAWELHTPLSAESAQLAARLPPLAEGYQTEIHCKLNDFVSAVTHALQSGLILFCDYGYGQNEYYHPQRTQGTLSCFHRHQQNSDPFLHPGQQDITAHVNFTQAIEAGIDCGADLLGFTTQAAFLLDCGLLDIAAHKMKGLSATAEFQLNQEIKLLTMPTEMGDVIKVAALGKNHSFRPKGFGLLDRRRDL